MPCFAVSSIPSSKNTELEHRLAICSPRLINRRFLHRRVAFHNLLYFVPSCFCSILIMRSSGIPEFSSVLRVHLFLAPAFWWFVLPAYVTSMGFLSLYHPATATVSLSSSRSPCSPLWSRNSRATFIPFEIPRPLHHASRTPPFFSRLPCLLSVGTAESGRRAGRYG